MWKVKDVLRLYRLNINWRERLIKDERSKTINDWKKKYVVNEKENEEKRMKLLYEEIVVIFGF